MTEEEKQRRYDQMRRGLGVPRPDPAGDLICLVCLLVTLSTGLPVCLSVSLSLSLSLSLFLPVCLAACLSAYLSLWRDHCNVTQRTLRINSLLA